MKFDELDQRMRVFETAHDLCVLPGIWMVARLDGRNFTRLTKETHQFEAPFDVRFRDAMVETAEHLMTCGFQVIYAYTESDEISLLFHRDESLFGRKVRKYNSILSGEASAKISLILQHVAVLDCRVSQLPTAADVMNYFRWRSEDAHRNALNAHAYWRLRGEGLSPKKATAQLDGLSIAAKNELLFQRGINFSELPAWQRRGVGLYWTTVEMEGFNPKTGERTSTARRRIFRNFELPMRDEYSQFVSKLLEDSSAHR